MRRYFIISANIVLRWFALARKMPGIVQMRRWYHHQRADVVLISFPKSGRTWLRSMFGRAIQQYHGADPKMIMRTSSLRRLDPRIPLIRSTHDDFAHEKTPDKIESKKRQYASKRVIFLARDPRDVIVSLYYQKKFRRRREITYHGTLKDFLRESTGGIESIVTFYNVWAENRHLPRDFLLIKYEDIVDDPERELRRMLCFLDIDWLPDAVIAEAVRFGSFDNLKKIEADNLLGHGALSTRDRNNDEAYKVRKGKVGGYVDYLSVEQIAHLNHVIEAGLVDYFDCYK